jgi:Ca-activated chloride channel family protein
MTKRFLVSLLCLVLASMKAQMLPLTNDTSAYRVLFILDASYSMDRRWENERLWDIATRTLKEFSVYLDHFHHAEMGLRVYGHNAPLSLNDCRDTKLEVPIRKNQSKAIIRKLDEISFKGTTPIIYSLEKAVEDFGYKSPKNIIILITDGEESCADDPCRAVRKIMEQNIYVKPVVIGMNINELEYSQLNCLGHFYNSFNPNQLKENLYKAFDEIKGKTTFSIFLKNNQKSISETNVPISILDRLGKPSEHIYHSLGNNMKPDTLFVVPSDTISLRIHSIPPMTVSNIPIREHKHTDITIDFPIGTMIFQYDTIIAGLAGAPFTIRQNNEIIYQGTFPDTASILAGVYDVEIYSLPQKVYKSINVEANKERHILVKPNGTLHVNKNFDCLAYIYKKTGQRMEKIYTIDKEKKFERVTLDPGDYMILYRSTKAISMYASKETHFEIRPGQITNVEL